MFMTLEPPSHSKSSEILSVGSEGRRTHFMMSAFVHPSCVFSPEHFGTKFVNKMYDCLLSEQASICDSFFRETWRVFHDKSDTASSEDLAHLIASFVEKNFPADVFYYGIETAVIKTEIDEGGDVKHGFPMEYYWVMTMSRLLAPIWSHWTHATGADVRDGEVLGWRMLNACVGTAELQDIVSKTVNSAVRGDAASRLFKEDEDFLKSLTQAETMLVIMHTCAHLTMRELAASDPTTGNGANFLPSIVPTILSKEIAIVRASERST